MNISKYYYLGRGAFWLVTGDRMGDAEKTKEESLDETEPGLGGRFVWRGAGEN